MSTLHTMRLHALACAVVSCLCAPAALAQDTAATPAHGGGAVSTGMRAHQVSMAQLSPFA